MKIGILYICTGKYEKFFDEFFSSFEEKFLTNHEKHYFVFTDSNRLFEDFSQNARIHFYKTSHIAWPLDTLLRFHFFLSIREELEKMDFLLFVNANAKCIEPISDAEFLPNNSTEKLIACQHTWLFDKPRIFFPFERNPRSEAFVPYWKGKMYYYGGLNGGFTKNYLELVETCWEKAKKDLSKNHIARWHDESYINHYFLGRKDLKVLIPAYLFPEWFEKRFEKKFSPKIIIRDKKIFQNNWIRDIL